MKKYVLLFLSLIFCFSIIAMIPTREFTQENLKKAMDVYSTAYNVAPQNELIDELSDKVSYMSTIELIKVNKNIMKILRIIDQNSIENPTEEIPELLKKSIET